MSRTLTTSLLLAVCVLGNLAHAQRPMPDDAYSRGDYGKAVLDLTTQIEVERNNPLLYVKRGNAYLGLGNSYNATANFNKAIELDPALADAYAGRGYLGLKGGTTKRLALADFDKAVKLDPQNADAHFGRFAILSLLGEKKEAQEAGETALGLDQSLGSYLDPSKFGDARLRSTGILRVRQEQSEAFQRKDEERREAARQQMVQQQEMLEQQQQFLQQQRLERQQRLQQRRELAPRPQYPQPRSSSTAAARPTLVPSKTADKPKSSSAPNWDKCHGCDGTGRCKFCKGIGYRGARGYQVECSACQFSPGLCLNCQGTGKRR